VGRCVLSGSSRFHSAPKIISPKGIPLPPDEVVNTVRSLAYSLSEGVTIESIESGNLTLEENNPALVKLKAKMKIIKEALRVLTPRGK